MRLEEIDLDTWGSQLPSTGFEVFHLPEALEVLADHTGTEMRLYGVYKGQEAVGLFPAFVKELPLGRAVLSPPPDLGVPRLGPLVMPTSPKQRKREAVNREFVDLLVDELDVGSRRSLLRVVCASGYSDPRPFDWRGFRVGQAFTYVLDLADESAESVKRGFTRDLRREVNSLEDVDVTVAVEGAEMAANVREDVADRYEEQGETFPASAAFFEDLVAALGERARVYVARTGDGEYLGGIVVLYSNDTAAFWQGGAAASHDGVSVNSALHWATITDLLEDPPVEGVRGYDLVGANTPRICRYKSKFGGAVRGYATVESDGVGMAAAKRTYSLVGR